MMKNVVSWGMAVALLVGAVGCVATSGSFKLSNVGRKQAAIAGRLTIIYNGQLYTENCFATFTGGRQKLGRDGIVLLVVPEGRGGLVGVECKDFDMQHVHTRGVYFYARGHGVVTDIGDIAVTWEAEGGPKTGKLLSALLKSALPLGALGKGVADAAGEAMDARDDGVAMVAVRPSVAQVRAAFKAQTGVDGTWSTALASSSSEPVAVPPPSPVPPPLASAKPGFVCTYSLRQANLDICVRTTAACEQLRERLAKRDLSACGSQPTAWCFAMPDTTRCFGALQACEAQRKKFDAAYPCHEEDGGR